MVFTGYFYSKLRLKIFQRENKKIILLSLPSSLLVETFSNNIYIIRIKLNLIKFSLNEKLQF